MPGHLRLALESIAAQQTKRRLEVLVCDDGSLDETPQVLRDFARQAPFPVRFLTHPHTEFHAARCRNDGVRHTQAPLLLFFDGDCVLPPDHLERHLAFWQPGSVNCGYCIRFGPGATQYVDLEAVRAGHYTDWAPASELRKLRKMHFKSLLYRLIRHPTKPAFRSTNFLLAKEDYLRVNGFDEQYRGWGCEDDDIGRRFRAAGIRLRSVLHKTRVYHLWHPPAPSRPEQWKQGSNVAYLQRPMRLTQCLQGFAPRGPRDLSVRVASGTADDALRKWIAAQGWSLADQGAARTDIEVASHASGGRFSSTADCRVLVAFDESSGRTSNLKSAHIVLSRSGTLGRPEQIRLRLHDTAGLWAALRGDRYFPQRAAA
jgi:GT2 family glycosyltransferase